MRRRALADGKELYMAVPRLADPRPFLRLDPGELAVPPRKAASIRGAGVYGRPVALDEMPHIDLVVCGTVAVGRDGVRIGKGGGFSDLEFALLTEEGCVDGATVLATTVHPLQIVDRELPETPHDFRVDVIVTPDEVIECPGARDHRPAGIVWGDLGDEKIAEVPVLASRRGRG